MGILVSVFLPLALVIIMFSLGLGLRAADFARVLRFPRAVIIGAFAQLLLLPSVAFVLTIAFGLAPQLALGLMILSFCPGGATSNMLTKLAQGDVALSITLTGLMSLISVLTLPILLGFFGRHFLGFQAPPVDVAGLGLALFLLTTLPVVFGIALRSYYPAMVARIDRPVSWLALALFMLVIVGALAANWPMFVENLLRLGPSVVALNITMLAAGLLLARLFSLQRAEATTISIETGIQNAALGITVGSLIAESTAGFPPFSLPSGVYGITMYFMALPFALWRRHLALRAGG